MFSERFDALMNIAEISNSQLGRFVNMNSSHIGRLRSGARPLPKKHEYISSMCRCILGHIQKDYQFNALQRLTGICHSVLASSEDTITFLERWLLEKEGDTSAATGRLISGFSQLSSSNFASSSNHSSEESSFKYSSYLYGNAGKRKAVEQFFLMVLQEDKPQTLLLFSDENMAWLYEDAAFAKRWAELFTKVVMKGNRVRIIHTVSRDLNEMLEAVTKWIPIYRTGMISPYLYPRLRDGLFQRTMFIAPNTAAIISSSVQHDTNGMLNLFITDKAAIKALTEEFNHYFALCRPLMDIFTWRESIEFQSAIENLISSEGDAYFYCTVPPLFSAPEKLVKQFSEQTGNDIIINRWKQSLTVFKKNIKTQKLTLILSDPACVSVESSHLQPLTGELLQNNNLTYSTEQFEAHIKHLKQMEKTYDNLTIYFRKDIPNNTILYIKEDLGVIMSNTGTSKTAFILKEKNMINAFRDYMSASR